MWLEMFKEQCRELNYTADQAGVRYKQSLTEGISFELFSYNDSYHQFFAEVFKEIKDFKPSEKFFESKKEQIQGFL